MKKLILIPVGVFLAFFILFQTVFIIGIVPSSSMEPTLHEGDIILGTRFAGEYRTGDVIIFEHDGVLMVKRIAASGEEMIETDKGPLTVPQSCYYVLGDNPADSVDSRFWDDPFITAGDIKAKVILPAR